MRQGEELRREQQRRQQSAKLVLDDEHKKGVTREGRTADAEAEIEAQRSSHDKERISLNGPTAATRFHQDQPRFISQYRHQLKCLCRQQEPRLKTKKCLNKQLLARLLSLWLTSVSIFVSVQGQSTLNPSLLPVSNPTLLPATPTASPSLALTPSPTDSPSVTAAPSSSPAPTTKAPTLAPTLLPSRTPTSRPTFFQAAFSKQRYKQTFLIPNNTAFFSDPMTLTMARTYASYTSVFAPNISSQVKSFCQVQGQSITSSVNQSTYQNYVSFTCEYTSLTADTAALPNRLLIFLNLKSQLQNITTTFQSLGFPILQAGSTLISQVRTAFPTASMAPSVSPSASPTATPKPVTSLPTTHPTTQFEPTQRPTASSIPPTIPPPTAPQSGSKVSVALTATLTILVGVAILVALVCFYQRSKKKQFHTRSRGGRAALGVDAAGGEVDGGNHLLAAATGDSMSYLGVGMEKDIVLGAVISPSASMASNKSLLSAGSGISTESDDELDGTKNLQDEFDHYKDQNLELLRNNVEGNMSGFEGVMSSAVTKALMGDDDAKVDPSELFWGCDGHPSGEQIEASALCEVNDWLKRNETSPVERKRAFMQDMLNKMVASVRYGVLGPEDAARSIHEAAALLGLQIANELPMTTVLLSGMRKTVASDDMIRALREFGDIDTAAVASGERGFGIVRFRHPKSADRAMRRYRNAEIVVQDVAVQFKVLLPSGEVQSRT